MSTDDIKTDTCATCHQDIRFVTDGERFTAEHVLGDFDHEATSPLGAQLEVLVRRMRVFLMCAERGGPAPLLGAALNPLRTQMLTLHAELGLATYIEAVQGRITDEVANIIGGDVTVPDDISGLF